MTEPIRKNGKYVERLVVTGKRVARVEPSDVAAALGGEPAGESILGSPCSLSLYAIRAELLKQRQSSGGRPAIEGATSRVKIPLSPADWQRLEEIAAAVGTDGFSPSPGQVANILLTAALRGIPPSPIPMR